MSALALCLEALSGLQQKKEELKNRTQEYCALAKLRRLLGYLKFVGRVMDKEQLKKKEAP